MSEFMRSCQALDSGAYLTSLVLKIIIETIDLHSTLYKSNKVVLEPFSFRETKKMMYKMRQILFSSASNQEVSVAFKMRYE